MKPTALFIGSIGVMAETSDIQRRAYNQALKEAGLDWEWDKETYRELLTDSGGVKRLSRLNQEKEANLSDDDIKKIHARKTELACQEIVNDKTSLRPGVAELIAKALEQGIKVALVTSTYQENIDAIAEAAGDDLPVDKLSAVMTRDDAENNKPAPDVYLAALKRLLVDSSEVIAIEDSEPSLKAAKQAGIYTVVTPGKFTDQQDFSEADQQLESLEGFKLTIPG